MALLYVSNYVLGKFPGLLVTAESRTEVILAAIGKIIYESILLRIELVFYMGTSLLLGLLAGILMGKNSPVLILLGITTGISAIAFAIYIPEIVAIYRTLRRICAKNIQIVDIKQTPQ